MNNILLTQKQHQFDANKWLQANVPEYISGGFYRNSKVTHTSEGVHVFWVPSMRLTSLLLRHQDKFNRSTALKLMQEHEVVTPSPFSVVHQDLLLLVQWLKNNEQNIEPDIALYVSRELGVSLEEMKERLFAARKNVLRPTMFDIKKTSLYWDKENNILENEHLGSSTLLKLLGQCSFIKSIEVESDVNFKKLEKHLINAKKVFQKINRYKVLKHDLQNKSFHLRIRKIRRTKKSGMYMENLNAIFIDPRHMSSFKHELAHWLLLNVSEEGRTKMEELAQHCRGRRSIKSIKRDYPQQDWQEEIWADRLEKWFSQL